MRLPILPLVVATSLLSCAAFAGVELKEADGKVRVEIDGKLFTEYVYTGAPHVYFYPVIGPGEAKMTRSWPMEDVPNEDHDHYHHRSLWFAHGDVNGVDFWAEPKSFGPGKEKPTGQIVHEKFLAVKSGEKEGTISDQLKWVAPDGSVPLTSVQTVTFHSGPASERVLDFEVKLQAGDKDVVMGDTKEGAMAMRINESMRLVGPKKQPGQGHIANSAGEKDGDVWGKHAEWVDMSGPIDGKTYGIAIFDNPKNPRHPTRWHARDYGLFAANPFCEHDMDKTKAKGEGDFKIAAGQSATFRYRIVIHEGDAAAAKIAERYADYASKAQ